MISGASRVLRHRARARVSKQRWHRCVHLWGTVVDGALSGSQGGISKEAVAAFLLAVDQVATALREGGERAVRVLDAVPPAHVRVLAEQLTRIAERFEGDRIEIRPEPREADGPGAN